jgi:bifunctional enzyme CysN/CysC
VAGDRDPTDVRFPVQYVIRPQSDAFHDYRGYAGTVASGVLRPGDPVQVLPSGRTTTVAGIDGPRGPVEEAFPPMAVTVRLADDLDVSRGDLLCAPEGAPEVTQDLDALVCWMADEPLRPRQRLAVKHTSRSVRAVVREVVHRLDVNTLDHEEEAGELGLNDIGRVRLRTTQPLFVDDYTHNRATGRFILVDEATNATVGAGMLVPH